MSAAHLEQMSLAPLDFLKQNLLCLVGPMPNLRGIYHFSYEPAPASHCQREPGFLARERYPTRVWHVRLVPRAARSGFPAFFLPALPGQMSRSLLPRDAQFLLAETPPGCVFGVARYRQGGVEACQAGLLSDPVRLARETAWCSTRLTPGGALATTILGVNHPRQGWQFHAQRWEKRNPLLFHYQELVTL